MRLRKQLFLVLFFTAVCTSAGCRSGVSAHGHSLSLFLVPMYKQPAGFSSTYKEHLAMTQPVIEHAAGVVSGPTLQPIIPTKDDSITPSEKVIFPEPCGPECRQPPADGQTISTRPAQQPNRIAKRYTLISPQ